MCNKHKHAELIKQWADGAIIEVKGAIYKKDEWQITTTPRWDVDYEYRVQPTPKPDIIVKRTLHYNISTDNFWSAATQKLEHWSGAPTHDHLCAINVQITFDGETREPVAVEIIK
jgi:hypothetical protein